MKTSKCILAVVVAAALLIAAASAQTVCKCSKQKVFGGCTVLTSNGDGTCNSELVSPCSPCACDADGSLECEVAMGSAYAFTVAPACELVETSYAICPESTGIANEQDLEQPLNKAEFQRI